MKISISKKTKNILFSFILVVYSLMLVNKGITVTDTGYNYSNYVNFDSLDNMWKFSTYLALALGSFFTRLPYGRTLLGLNIYTGIVKSLCGVLTYLICTKHFKMKQELAFIAELIALGYCWCPTALLYNYCTYLLFTMAGVLLCLAMQYNKNIYLFIAGCLLGVNVFVRLPNLAEIALIFPVWFYCFFKRIKFGELLKKTFICIGGFCSGVAIILGFIFIKYGPKQYIEGIMQMLAVSDQNSGYSLTTMIREDILLYMKNIKWIVAILALILIGTLVNCILKDRFKWLKRIIYVACNIALIIVFKYMKMYSFVYYNYDGIYSVGIFFLLIAGLLGLYVMFFGKDDYDFRMRAMVMGIIILITPLGSNNLLFSAENNMFFVVPFVLEVAFRIYEGRENYYIKIKQSKLSIEPLLISLIVCISFVAFQGILFGARFVFRDGIDGSYRDSKISENAVLKGVYTTKENADSLNELNEYIVQNGLRNKEVLLYNNVPALSFYMEMKPVISTTWPDLESYSYDKFENDLLLLSDNIKAIEEKPCIILGIPLDEKNMKVSLLMNFIENEKYEKAFENSKYLIYR